MCFTNPISIDSFNLFQIQHLKKKMGVKRYEQILALVEQVKHWDWINMTGDV